MCNNSVDYGTSLLLTARLAWCYPSFRSLKKKLSGNKGQLPKDACKRLMWEYTFRETQTGHHSPRYYETWESRGTLQASRMHKSSPTRVSSVSQSRSSPGRPQWIVDRVLTIKATLLMAHVGSVIKRAPTTAALWLLSPASRGDVDLKGRARRNVTTMGRISQLTWGIKRANTIRYLLSSVYEKGGVSIDDTLQEHRKQDRHEAEPVPKEVLIERALGTLRTAPTSQQEIFYDTELLIQLQQGSRKQEGCPKEYIVSTRDPKYLIKYYTSTSCGIVAKCEYSSPNCVVSLRLCKIPLKPSVKPGFLQDPELIQISIVARVLLADSRVR